jgi:hypothetical protein
VSCLVTVFLSSDSAEAHEAEGVHQ